MSKNCVVLNSFGGNVQQGPLVYEEELTEEDGADFFLLVQAVQCNETTTVESILKQKPYLCSLSTEMGITPLIAAVCLSDVCANETIFKLIINNPYSDLNAQNAAGYSALHFMAENNHYALLALFLKQKNQKINLNLLTSDTVPDDDKQFSSVYLAASKGNKEALHLLIQNGADVNVPTGVFKWSPLHVACLRGHEDCVYQLLEKGANPNAVDSDNATPLHLLAITQDIETATFENIKQMLVDAKANFRIKSSGFMADEFAAHSPHPNALVFGDALKYYRVPTLKEMCLELVNPPEGIDSLAPRFSSLNVGK